MYHRDPLNAHTAAADHDASAADAVADRAADEPGSLEIAVPELAASGALANAGRDAIRAQVERGIPVTFLRGEQVVKRHPDGREEVLEVVVQPAFKPPAGVPLINGT